jgi:hypothetical protein
VSDFDEKRHDAPAANVPCTDEDGSRAYCLLRKPSTGGQQVAKMYPDPVLVYDIPTGVGMVAGDREGGARQRSQIKTRMIADERLGALLALLEVTGDLRERHFSINTRLSREDRVLFERFDAAYDALKNSRENT